MNSEWNRRRMPKAGASIPMGGSTIRVRRGEKVRAALIRRFAALGVSPGTAAKAANDAVGATGEALAFKVLRSLGLSVDHFNAEGERQRTADGIAGTWLVEVKATPSDNGKIVFSMGGPEKAAQHGALRELLGLNGELCVLVIVHRDATAHMLIAEGFANHNPKNMSVLGHYCLTCNHRRVALKVCQHAQGTDPGVGDIL